MRSNTKTAEARRAQKTRRRARAAAALKAPIPHPRHHETNVEWQRRHAAGPVPHKLPDFHHAILACHPRQQLPLSLQEAQRTATRLPKRLRGLAEEHHTRFGETVPRGRSDVLIPNPRYTTDLETPRYAALRLVNGFSKEFQAEILRAVDALKKCGLKSKTTSAHGEHFHQEWFGVWRKYSKTSNITAAETSANPKQASAIRTFLQTLDSGLDRISAKLRMADEPAWFRARYQHRGVAELIQRTAEEQPTKPTSKILQKDPSRGKNSAFRIGGIGTMVAVSSGEGTAYHYDTHDDSRQYSVVIPLGRSGVLHLPETGYSLVAKPGDVLAFLANQQYHKFEADPTDSGGEQIVLTLWSDAQTAANTSQGRFWRTDDNGAVSRVSNP